MELTRQSWGADVIKSRWLVGTPVPAERALSESWSFVGFGPGGAGPDRSRSQDITHRLGIKENQGRAPHVSPKRVLDLDEVSLSSPQTSEGPCASEASEPAGPFSGQEA